MKTKSYSKLLVLVSAIFFLISAITANAATFSQAIIFGSDVHYTGTSTPLTTLTGLANYAYTNYNSTVTCLIGDYGNGGSDTTTTAQYTAVYNAIPSTMTKKIMTSGNHEAGTGLGYSPTGYKDSTAWADIYVINPLQFNAGNQTYLKNTTVVNLSSFLNTKKSTGRVKIIICHLPLHSTRTCSLCANNTDSTRAGYINQNIAKGIFNMIQSWGDKEDIIYLWGHNHSSSAYDAHVNMVALRGSTIGTVSSANDANLNSLADSTLKFSSINAGYVNDKLTMSVIRTPSDAKSTIYIHRLVKSSSHYTPTTYTLTRIDPYYNNWSSSKKPSNSNITESSYTTDSSNLITGITDNAINSYAKNSQITVQGNKLLIKTSFSGEKKLCLYGLNGQLLIAEKFSSAESNIYLDKLIGKGLKGMVIARLSSNGEVLAQKAITLP